MPWIEEVAGAPAVWLPGSLVFRNPAPVGAMRAHVPTAVLGGAVMASRSMYVGDTYPAALLQVSDETGVLNLSSASSVEVQFIGKNFEFSGGGTAIWPAEPDPNGTNNWNLSFPFAAGDTANVDVYAIYVVVTWTSGQIETFPTSDTLSVLALP